jgi:SAM-dependent methyltransferase
MIYKEYFGIEVVELFPYIVEDKQVFELLERILTITYREFLGKKGLDFIKHYLSELSKLTLDSTWNEINSIMLDMRNRFADMGLLEYYFSDFRRENLQRSIKIVGIEYFKNCVADIGADDNMLGSVLLNTISSVDYVVGIDLRKNASTVTFENLDFKVYENRTALPLETHSIDAVVLRYVLHHLTFDTQAQLLHEVKRILQPNARCIILENSYSFMYSPINLDQCELHNLILDLGSPSRIKLLLIALDIISNGIKSKNMLFPHSYRAVEDWVVFFDSIGFNVKEARYYGLPIIDLHQAPLSVFILENELA